MDRRTVVCILFALAVIMSTVYIEQGGATVTLPKTWVASETLKAADLNANFAALKGAIDTIQPDALPAGTFVFYGGSALPTGWVRPDGTAVGKATYAALYSALGDYWNDGTEATGSFRLPNLSSFTITFTTASGTATLTMILKE